MPSPRGRGIIIPITIFSAIVMTQGHCEELLGSSDECRKRQVAANPQIKPPDLGCESACFRQLSSTNTVAIYYSYSAQKLILIYRPKEGRRLS